MNKKEIEQFKERLTKEKVELEQELSNIGTKDSAKNSNWDPSSTIEVDSADENEVADKFEEMEENSGIMVQLKSQLSEVEAALSRIEKGTYGICEVCGKPIEKERMEANPSAKISIKHGHK